jgi:hypothetical protein
MKILVQGNTYFYLLIFRHFYFYFNKNETCEFSIFRIRNFVALGTLEDRKFEIRNFVIRNYVIRNMAAVTNKRR